MHHIFTLGFPSFNAAHEERRKTMEEIMNFNLNRNDLATKSTAQLAALFQDASRAIAANNATIASAHSLLAMIAQELGRRGPAP